MAIDSINGRIHPNHANTKLTTTPSNATPAGATQGAAAVDVVAPPITERIKSTLTSGSEPPVNSEKVATLKQAIADGSYKVDADRVADKMLSVEKQLPASI